MVSENKHFLDALDFSLITHTVISNDLERVNDPTFDYSFDVTYQAALDYLTQTSYNNISGYQDILLLYQESSTEPLDLRSKKPMISVDLKSNSSIKVASFANNLASQPNINIIPKVCREKPKKDFASVEKQKMRKERLLDARQRLKHAKRIWKKQS